MRCDSQVAGAQKWQLAMDPETLSLLTNVYKQAAMLLPPDDGADDEKTALAATILEMAEAGERSPYRLLAGALSFVSITGGHVEAAPPGSKVIKLRQ